jgi:hypothetical protein
MQGESNKSYSIVRRASQGGGWNTYFSLEARADKLQTSLILEIALAKSTHWRYAIFATRCLRTLVRKDAPISAPHMRYFLEKCYDNHPSLVRIL